MRRFVVLVFLAWTTPAAHAADRVIGLLSLPEVLAPELCDKFRPAEISLFAAPNPRDLIGSIRVEKHSTVPGEGECAGDVRVARFRGVGDDLWIDIEVVSDSSCQATVTPTVRARGWIPAHAPSGDTTVWFYSRGC